MANKVVKGSTVQVMLFKAELDPLYEAFRAEAMKMGYSDHTIGIYLQKKLRGEL